MALKKFKPTTPGRRQMLIVRSTEITAKSPEKSLTRRLYKHGGRNNMGRITTRHHGGGAVRSYRIIDFKQKKIDVPARVNSLEYDPNRSALIALIFYKDGEKAYIIAPQGLKVGDDVIISKSAPIKPGNRLPLANIPLGLQIYNLELETGRGGQIIRSAGSAGTLIAKEGDWAQVKLPSGEVRKISKNCFASIGVVSCPEHNLIVSGKAGRSRWLGIRPTVRGSVMNPVDHPHGGGEGKAPIGLVHPKTPWGKPALGVKTRKRKKYSDRFIVRRRK